MDGHKLRSIHGTRCFFTKNNAIDEITGRLQATRLTWKAWLARADAFKNVDPCRSYASVLQQSTSPTVHKYFATGDNGTATETCQKATKNSLQSEPTITNNSTYIPKSTKHSIPLSYGQSNKKQGQCLTLANRFHVLAQLEEVNSNVQPICKSNNAAFTFKGNKNRKGQILGSALTHGGHDTTDMEISDYFKGNKNKTGQILGTSMQSPYLKSVQCHTANNASDNQHASLLFKGNKNGKGQTLGSMSDNSTNNCDAKEKINIKTIFSDETPLLGSQSDSVLSQSVFPQSMSDGTDNTDTSDHNQDHSHLLGAPVWDMAYTNHKRNKFIPHTVVYNKYQSVDLVRIAKPLALFPIMT